MSERAFGIEEKSFQIIENEAGDHGYSKLEWPLVRRAIHATADFDFCRDSRVLFHPNSLDSGFAAIASKCTIVTDVEMVLSAINKKAILDLGLKTACYISDKEVARVAAATGQTRSECAMRHAAKEIDGGIVAIGNAPTALYEVLRMAGEKIARPSLVVGIPVGFVSAAESKEALAKSDIPYITNVGRKGGSPVASSIVNALLLLYQSGHLRE